MVKNDFRATIKLLAVLLFAIISITAFIFYDICSNDTFSTIYSPSGKLKAVVTERDCGATTSYNYILTIGKYDQSFFLTKTAWVYGALRNEKERGVDLQWASESEVLVRFHSSKLQKIEQNPVVIGDERIKVTFIEGDLLPTP
ncbi:MAG: hypothetical protein ACLGSA_12400 [Acidobacteriota bacterium]